MKPNNLPIDWEAKLSRIEELEKRPTTTELNEAVQETTVKYKEHKKLNTEEEEALKNYKLIKSEYNEWLIAFEGKSAEKVKREYEELKEKKEDETKEEVKNIFDANESLKTKIEEIKKDLEECKEIWKGSKSEEAIKEIGKTIVNGGKEIIAFWKAENSEKRGQKIAENQSLEINSLKVENESLWKIIKSLNPFYNEKQESDFF